MYVLLVMENRNGNKKVVIRLPYHLPNGKSHTFWYTLGLLSDQITETFIEFLYYIK